MKIVQLLSLPLLLAINATVFATTLPTESRVPGGIAHIPLSYKGEVRPEAWYRGNRVMVVENTKTAAADDWLAVVGIPLSISSDKPQRIKAAGVYYSFSVEEKSYREQRLKVKNKRHVNPDPEDLKRWAAEKKEMTEAFLSWRTNSPPVTRFQLPAEGPFSSPFGLKRFFNDQPRKPHSGLDIAAPEGAAVTAPAGGVVVATGNYFFNGNTIILDHGHGLTTLFCHLSKIEVSKGEQVSAEQIIGRVGSTGRVTGPHLHWSVSLNNTRVDPTLWFD